jgi:phage terminase Nu1 subunit (DNA packaging protein)
MPQIEVKQLMQALNLSEVHIGRLVKEGMPKEARGKYDLGKCMLWYIRYLQAALKRQSGSEPIDETGRTEQRERLRLLSAKAELKELELARELGVFIALPDLEKMMTDLVMTTNAQILGVASRIAPQLVGESRTVIEARLERALKDALRVLANSYENGNAIGTATSELTPSLANDSETESRNSFPAHTQLCPAAIERHVRRPIDCPSLTSPPATPFGSTLTRSRNVSGLAAVGRDSAASTHSGR